jgi:hypothetical protein
VFTPICTGCHTGAAAPLGFRLDADSAYAMLVNTPSAEVPALQRVTPGDPASSYLIQKLEGHAQVGGQMPLGQPPLPQATIDVIRQWIVDGAPPSPSPGAAGPMQVHAITPLQEEALAQPPVAIVVAATGELDVASVSAANVSLARSGGDGGFDEGNEVQMLQVQITARSLDPTVLALTLPDAWPADRYRLTISGHGPAGARDLRGAPIDDFVLVFSVGAVP